MSVAILFSLAGFATFALAACGSEEATGARDTGAADSDGKSDSVADGETLTDSEATADDGSEHDSADADTAGDAADDGLVSDDGDADPIGGPNAPVLTRTAACNQGPFTRTLEVEGVPCSEEPAAQCPSEPASTPTPALIIASCAMDKDDTECVPVFMPDCPLVGDNVPLLDANLINPNEGSPFGCWGRAHIFPTVNADGTVDVELEGFGGKAPDCDYQRSGEIVVHLEPCCEEVVDFYFPAGDFTFRLQLQLDWTPKAP